MTRYLLSRIVQSFLLFFGVLIVVFFMIRLTGDPISLMLNRNASQEQRDALRETLGLNKPLYMQFFNYAADVLQGDLGKSLHFKQPARDIILERLPATFYLATAALLGAIIIAVPIGIIGGSNPGSLIDSLGRSLGLMGQTIPNFWLGLILILVFAVGLGWFPSFGRDSATSVVLPAIALGLGSMGQLVRLTRSSVLEIRGEDYIRTAKSKGISQFKIGLRHITRNTSLVLISVIGISYSYLLGGSIYIETIFAWPGLGSLLEQSLNNRDFPLIMGITLVFSSLVIILNLLTDIAYAFADPRIRYGS